MMFVDIGNRRLEDKAEELGISLRMVHIHMAQSKLHGNADVPCNFVAWVGVMESSLPSKGLAHRGRSGDSGETTANIKSAENRPQ